MYTVVTMIVFLPDSNYNPSFTTMGEKNAKELHEKLKAEYPNALNIKVITEKQKWPVCFISTRGRGSEFSPKRFKLIKLGDSRDSRGSYLHTNFSCLEYEEDAKQYLKPKYLGEQTKMDSYYIQRWV